MSAAFPAAVGPMLLAVLALIALLIPTRRPAVSDPDPADWDDPAWPGSRTGNAACSPGAWRHGSHGGGCWSGRLVGAPRPLQNGLWSA